MFHFWHGPIVGQTVSHVWHSFAWCIFMEFGRLTPGEWHVDRKGVRRQYQPRGEWTITSMDSWPTWKLFQKNRELASSDTRCRGRDRALRCLIGRRVSAIEIDKRSRATRLRFSQGFVLETQTTLPSMRREHHWLIRAQMCVSGDYRPVVLGLSGRGPAAPPAAEATQTRRKNEAAET